MATSPQTPPYRVLTPRLEIRCWQPTDAAPLKAAIDASLDHLRQWLPWASDEPRSLDERIGALRTNRANFDRDEDYRFGIFDRDDGRLLGSIGFHTRRGPKTFEIGYWILADSLRQGFATEAVAAMTRVGIEYCGRERIELHIDVANVVSAAIPSKLGFVHEATRRRFLEPTMHDAAIWTLHRDAYESMPRPPLLLYGFDAAGRAIIALPFSPPPL